MRDEREQAASKFRARGAADTACYQGSDSVLHNTCQVTDRKLRRGSDVQHHPLHRWPASREHHVRQGLRRQPLVGGQQAQGRRGAVVRRGLPREGGVVVAGERGLGDCRRHAARCAVVCPASIATCSELLQRKQVSI